VLVFAGYVVLALQNGALKWKKKMTRVRSHAVTCDHTLKLKLYEENPQLKFIMLYMKFAGIV
jgi:hypothetical protein